MRIQVPPETGRVWQQGDSRDQLVAVPDCLIVTIDDGSLDWDVSVTIGFDAATESHVVDAVTIRRRPGEGSPPASAAGIRHVPLGSIVADAVRASLEVWQVTGEDDDGKVSATKLTPHFRDGEWEMPPRPSAKAARRATGTRRRNAVPATTAQEALDLYNLAKREGRKNPYAWVGEQLGVARSTAHKYVTQAIKDGGKS
jgi:hypothetical protein